METYRELFDSYFKQIENLTKLANNYTDAYRLLIGSAGELNSIGLVKKKDIKKAIDRANQMGDILDVALDVIEKSQCCYLEYIRLQGDILELKTKKKLILQEVDNDLLFQNSKMNNKSKIIRDSEKENKEGLDLDFDSENYVYEDEFKNKISEDHSNE